MCIVVGVGATRLMKLTARLNHELQSAQAAYAMLSFEDTYQSVLTISSGNVGLGQGHQRGLRIVT